jgi:hypothetical protein
MLGSGIGGGSVGTVILHPKDASGNALGIRMDFGFGHTTTYLHLRGKNVLKADVLSGGGQEAEAADRLIQTINLYL